MQSEIVKPTMVFDMDGVIADIRHREHWIEDGLEPNWSHFFDPDEMVKDDIFPTTMHLLHIIRDYRSIVILTARPSTRYHVTRDWLDKMQVPYNYLVMRPADDHQVQRAATWKVAELNKLVWRRHAINGFFDDHPGNVRAAEAAGYPAILYDPGAHLRARGGDH